MTMQRVAVLIASVGLIAVACDGGIVVRGHVYGPNGEPLEGAKASLFSESGTRSIQEQESDASGCFAFHATVAPGRNEYRLLVQRDGYKPASAAVFSGRTVNEVETRMVGIESVGQSSSSSSERSLISSEATYFDVRCAGAARSDDTRAPNPRLQRMALRAAAEPPGR
jgi:hypothetical protein